MSSSAALEVSVMGALAAALRLPLDPTSLALLCQRVENIIVGAPCGAMDQLTVTCGHQNHMLALLCQPARVLGHQPVPAAYKLWGIDSGVTHSVGGQGYTRVRVATFIGKTILKDRIARMLRREVRSDGSGVQCGKRSVDIDETDVKLLTSALAALKGGEGDGGEGYLCNVTPG